jgi:hypothetical protein
MAINKFEGGVVMVSHDERLIQMCAMLALWGFPPPPPPPPRGSPRLTPPSEYTEGRAWATCIDGLMFEFMGGPLCSPIDFLPPKYCSFPFVVSEIFKCL